MHQIIVEFKLFTLKGCVLVTIVFIPWSHGESMSGLAAELSGGVPPVRKRILIIGFSFPLPVIL